MCGDLLPLFYLGAGASAYRKAAPHAVRDPVTMQGRDLRIGARAWAGAAR